ncbi:MAG: hypothetical protein KJO85_02405 [Gammaproteobacteria bacterium]|nr:hypothetical protein [Gammaproteobacteria bacterium]
MSFKYPTLLITAMLLGGCGSRFHVWVPKGPMNLAGPVKEITVHPENSRRIYASSENGGLWLLENYADPSQAWRPLTDFLENLQTRGFAISAIDPDFMVMGNGLGNIYLSFNSAGNWAKVNSPSFGYIRRIIADDLKANKTHVFYVASSTGLFHVDAQALGADAGASPGITLLKSGEITDLVRDRSDEGVMYVAVRNEGVYRSTDAGYHWERILLRDPSGMIKISRPALDGTVYVKDGANRLFRGDAPSPSLDLIELEHIACPNNDPGEKFCGECSDVGYRNPFGGHRNDWCHTIAVDPGNASTVIVGQTELFSSTDAGESWTTQRPGHEDHHDIEFVGDDLLIATDGGVMQAKLDEQGTVQFVRDLNNGLNTLQFFRMGVHGENAAGNADHNSIQYTMNLNAETPDWLEVEQSRYGGNSLEDDFVYPDIKNPNRFFVLFQRQQILRLNLPYVASNGDLLVFGDPETCTNPFIRFYENNRNQEFNNLSYAVGTVAQDPRASSNTMLMSTFEESGNPINEQDIYRISISPNSHLNPTGGPLKKFGDPVCSTPNEYETPVKNFPRWKISHNNKNVPIVSIAFSPQNDGSVYALDQSGKVLKKSEVNDVDGDWTVVGKVPAGQGEVMRQLLVNARGDDTGRATGPETSSGVEPLMAISQSDVYRSLNGGVGWVRLPFPLDSDNKINSITQHYKNVDRLFLATDRGVYESTNAGLNWHRFGIRLPNAPVMQIFVEAPFLYAVTFGRGLWRVDLENLLPLPRN